MKNIQKFTEKDIKTKEKELLSFNPKYFEPLDDEERELERALESDEFVPVKDEKEKIKMLKNAAKNTLNKIRKNSKITIRLNTNDLTKLKIKAKNEGIPYQTMLGSMIHKFVSKIDVKKEIRL
jgi:predicted DNA binding CopG/RHH family protein